MPLRPKREPRLRVVQSLHMNPDEHADVTAAARLSGESIAQFIRAAAADRAASLLPIDRSTTEDTAA
jgi:uncharacterized protein (DUF1778 family)